jgi:hypothetical protein
MKRNLSDEAKRHDRCKSVVRFDMRLRRKLGEVDLMALQNFFILSLARSAMSKDARPRSSQSQRLTASETDRLDQGRVA